MWFDSHCHLYSIEGDDPAIVVSRARDAGVEGILVVGVDAGTSRQAIELAGAPDVWAGAACHPSEARGWSDARAAEIDALLDDPRTVAVGESGLDLYRDRSFFEDQRRAFLAHVELSKRHRKALVIHTRDSIEETFDALEQVGPPERIVFHCWSGGPHEARRALEMGAYISFAGNVSFRSAEDLRAVAGTIPLDRLLVETDSPYLTPVPHRGRPNEPAFVAHVGDALAAARNEPVEVLAKATTENARRVFGLDG